MFGLNAGFVGIDIGYYYTKVVSVVNKKGIYTLQNAFKERTPENAITSEGVDEINLGDFLRSILLQHNVKIKNVAISLNSSFVITKSLNMPLVADEEIDQAIMWEAEQYAPVSMDKVNVSYQILHKNSEKNEMNVLIALTKKEIVESYKKAFKNAKLNLRIIDVDVFAAYNAYELNRDSVLNKHVAIIDVGYKTTKLLFVRRGVPTFSRYIDYSFSAIVEEAIDILDIKKEEFEHIILSKDKDSKKETLINFLNDKLVSLYTQIQNSTTFYISNILDVEEPLDEVVLTGVLGCLYDNLNIEVMRDFIKSDIVKFNPFDIMSKERAIFALDETTPENSPFYCVSCGLALRGIKK